jgi:hypothetical protein
MRWPTAVGAVAVAAVVCSMLAGCSAPDPLVALDASLRHDSSVSSVHGTFPTVGPSNVPSVTVRMKPDAALSDVERVAERFRETEEAHGYGTENANITILFTGDDSRSERFEFDQFAISKAGLKSELGYWAALRKALPETQRFLIDEPEDGSPKYTREFDVSVSVGADPTDLADDFTTLAGVTDPTHVWTFWGVGYTEAQSVDNPETLSRLGAEGALPSPTVIALLRQVLGYEDGPAFASILDPENLVVTADWWPYGSSESSKSPTLTLDLAFAKASGQSISSDLVRSETVAAAQGVIALGTGFRFTAEGQATPAEIDSPACAKAAPAADSPSGQLAAALSPLPATVSAGECP